MGYTITTLVENCVYGRKLQAEHGLSLYIETSGHRLLFDTGASDLFIRNARLLHIDGSPDKPGGLSIQLCKSEKKEFYIRYSS